MTLAGGAIAGTGARETPSMQRKTSGLVQAVLVFAVVLCLGCGRAVGQTTGPAGVSTPAAADPWPSLAGQIFNNRPLQDGGAVLAIDAPYRAEDAAVVPLTIRVLLPPADPRRIRKITLVIDENPSPLAAVFELGPDSGIDRISTRVRVNDYTNLHAVAEMSDGSLYVAQRFIKAAGGCSAPALKQVAGDIPIGTMRFRQFPETTGRQGAPEAELMIRHPNYSGMQMDQLTRYYIPAHFVRSVKIWLGDRELLAVEAGISISENPAFRFDYRRDGTNAFHSVVIDSKGQTFSGEWKQSPAPLARREGT
jgi:sulfur-oxidizing protein SoxY